MRQGTAERSRQRSPAAACEATATDHLLRAVAGAGRRCTRKAPPPDTARAAARRGRRLTYGAFDFVVTGEGRWVFLECNGAGQWGWLAEECGLPIAEAIADELVGGQP